MVFFSHSTLMSHLPPSSDNSVKNIVARAMTNVADARSHPVTLLLSEADVGRSHRVGCSVTHLNCVTITTLVTSQYLHHRREPGN